MAEKQMIHMGTGKPVKPPKKQPKAEKKDEVKK
jgi:hypothetical protein